MSSTGAAGGSKKPLIIIAAVIAVLGIAGTAGFLFYMNSANQANNQETVPPVTEEAPTTPVSEQTPPVVENPTPAPTETPTPAPAPEPTTPTPPGTTPTPSPTPLPEGLDTDKDLLTDMEEPLYATDTQKPDSDDDGFLDGNEVRFLFDPTKGASAKLEASASVSLFKNPTYQFGLLYPSVWVAKAFDESNREVIVSSATGEYFTVQVLDNSGKLSASQWYTTEKNPGADTSNMTSLSQAAWSGLVNVDGTEAYLTQKGNDGSNLPFIYVVTYNPATSTTLNFKSTFMMVVRSILSSASLLPK